MAGWLDERAIELQLQLSQAEDAVASFRIDNNLVSGEPGITLSEQRLTELNSELINTRAALAERRAVYARATEVVSSGGTTASLPEMQGSEIFATLRTLLLELERRETALGGPSTTNSRMTALREERAAIQRQLTDEVQRILGLIANEIETLELREQLIVDALTQAGGETGEASRSSVEMRELERRAAAYGALYERYLNNAGLVDESITYLISGVEVIDPANPPLDPRFPTPNAIIIFLLASGAMVGIGIGYGRESMQPGFMTARQIQRTLGRPVLASIPMLPPKASAWDMVRDLPMSPYAEAVRLLRHELSSRDLGRDSGWDSGRDPRGRSPVLLMTSAVPGEGKTSLAAALATSASSAGLNVLLIDADLRRGGTTRLFGAERDEGLTEVMRTRTYGFDDLVPGAGELDLLPKGAPVTSPTDLFAGANLPRYLAEARKVYDLIVIDGPPVANMADAPLLARLSDSVAFVVRWKDTPRDVRSRGADPSGRGYRKGGPDAERCRSGCGRAIWRNLWPVCAGIAATGWPGRFRVTKPALTTRLRMPVQEQAPADQVDEAAKMTSRNRLSVVIGIATTGRAGVVGRTVLHMAALSDLPDRVIVSVADGADMEATGLGDLPFRLDVLHGPKGSSAQRNTVLAPCRGCRDRVLYRR
ncbi:GumC family protein [Rhodophyticola sp.]|uniref:GumC family protein n=1 Tax=Rhodophyticola sp. TaxID=2680032 RepID=UPI003D277B8C